MPYFTENQARYLAFILDHAKTHERSPSPTEIAVALKLPVASVNQMLKTLEKNGLIRRQAEQPLSIQILVPEEEIPPWPDWKTAAKKTRPQSTEQGEREPAPDRVRASASRAKASNLYRLNVSIMNGPMTRESAKQKISRVIEIRGDQTLDDLHWAIYDAFDRFDEHLYEFQFGKKPMDRNGPTYTIDIGDPFGDPFGMNRRQRNAERTTLDSLQLAPRRVFWYWFDFGDDWFHRIQVGPIAEVDPAVDYPRVTERKGKSPPQYPDADDDEYDDDDYDEESDDD